MTSKWWISKWWSRDYFINFRIGYDSSRMPLGKLGNETIKKGYSILKKIAETINEYKFTKPKKKCLLESLSSEFYSYIPHNNGYLKLKSLETN